MVNTKVKLGPKAGSFYDSYTKILVRKNEVVELTPKQMNFPRIKNALMGGHLVMAVEDVNTPIVTVEDVNTPIVTLKDKYIEAYQSGKDVSKIFNLTDLKSIAYDFDIEVEDSDTKASIIDAINGEIK